jgi:hypothetical protein
MVFLPNPLLHFIPLRLPIAMNTELTDKSVRTQMMLCAGDSGYVNSQNEVEPVETLEAVSVRSGVATLILLQSHPLKLPMSL